MTIRRARSVGRINTCAAAFLVVSLVVGLIAGCSLLPGAGMPSATTTPSASPRTTPSTASATPTAGRTPTASGSATTGPAGRSLLPVPSVKPPGFVDPPPGKGMARYLDQRVHWSSCSDNEQCADVRVPLDWAHPNGQAITLRLGKVAATRTPHLGTLFVNPGGPGGSGVALARAFDRTGLEQYDIVGWDPRGAGDSTPVVCENGQALDAYYATDISPDSRAEDATLRKASRSFAVSCLKRSGALLEHISTLDTVHDLDFLRRLLGDKTLNYLGYSYGTYIGAVYASTYPKKVGRMVLDGAVNITSNTHTTQAEGFERALDDFAHWCADIQCGLGDSRHAVLSAVSSLLTRLDGHPLQVGDRKLTQSLAVNGIIDPLYAGGAAYQYLAQAISSARSGDGSMLLRSSDNYTQRRPNGQYGPLLTSYEAITCSEDTTTYPRARSLGQRAARQAPTIGPFLGIDYTCPAWPVPPEKGPGRLTGAGAAPIVVIGTTRDPATPYEYAKGMAKQLTSGVLLTYVGEGHTAYGGRSECIDTAVVRYFVHDDVPKNGTRCTS